MLRCDDLTVSYGSITALDEVSLQVAEGQIVAIMGESGSGKSTLLRVVAGLVDPAPGSVRWRERDITNEPPHLRHFGFMFQDYALFPHMSVGGNVAFGLRMLGQSGRQQSLVVHEMLELVGLTGYADRRIAELSGGEQQRVALARTLAPTPNLVLLDEPLGALDRARRDQLLSDMQRIFAELGVTALYVTHDHREAFAMADHVAVLDQGRKVAQATPADMWRRPERTAVATLLGFPVLRDVAVNDRQAMIRGIPVMVDIPDGVHHLAVAPGAVIVRATGRIPVTVRAARFEDGVTQAVIDLAGIEVLATAPHGVAIGPASADIAGASLVAVRD